MIPTDYCFHWIGGKRSLRKTIYELLPVTIEKFSEVFCGGCFVTLGRERIGRCEVINDLNGDLINFYRVIRDNLPAVEKEFEFLFHSREQFEYYLNLETDDPVKRAVKFFYVVSMSYSGDQKHFGFPYRPINTENMLARAKATSKRLKETVIENLPYDKFIEAYDYSDMFFYLDPPYVCKKIYNDEEKYIHPILAEMLKKIKGRFMLSYNDCELVRDLYKDFRIVEVERQNSFSRTDTRMETNAYKEVIIMNYEKEGLF